MHPHLEASLTWRRLALATLVALGLAAGPARAEGPLRKGYLLVLASAPTPEAARAALARTPQLEVLKLAAGFPRIVESARVSGLRPGFHVVVGGICEARSPAEVARQVLDVAAGADFYVREVEVPADAFGCPALVPAGPRGSFPVAQEAPLDARSPDVRWVLRKKKLNERCAAWQVELVAGGVALFREDHRDEGCKESSIDTTRFDIKLARVGDAAYARVSNRHDWHDNGTRQEDMLDLACKDVHSVLDLGNQYDSVEAISPVKGASPRARLRLRWHRMECSNCKASGEFEYARAPDGCSFRPVGQDG